MLDRYAMKISNIESPELDLLECLVRIDAQLKLDTRADQMLERLIEAGLVSLDNGELRLTYAGIERCRSLKHRIAGDEEAARILAGRGILLASELDSDRSDYENVSNDHKEKSA